MAIGSPELVGIPRLAQIVFIVTDNPQQNSHKKAIGSIHRLWTVLFALSIHFLWQFHRPRFPAYYVIFYHTSRPFLYTFGCILYLINYLITSSGAFNIRPYLPAGTIQGQNKTRAGSNNFTQVQCALQLHMRHQNGHKWHLRAAQILGMYSAVKSKYRPARQAIWVIQVVLVASNECGWELIKGFLQFKRALTCGKKHSNSDPFTASSNSANVQFILSYYCSFVKEHPPPIFGPIFCIGSKFVWMSAHPGASIAWLMSAHMEFEKHTPSAMHIWAKKHRVLDFTEGYDKAALRRQT